MPFHQPHAAQRPAHHRRDQPVGPLGRRSASSSAPASRDETPEVSGVSHFLEHMVFKGTPRRTALDVNRDFDRIGADYNAFTSEENTVFYAAVLPEYLPQAVDILADILRPSLRDDDFDMEKKVIIEEIGMYEDQPMWSAYDHAKQALLRRPPAGQQRPRHRREHHGPDARPDARLLRPPLRRPEHHGRRRPATSTGTSSSTWSRSTAARWHDGPSGRDRRPPRPPARGTFEVVTKEKVTQEHVFLIVARPGRRRRRCATPPTRWPWSSATTPAAGCTGRWSIRAWPTRPTCSFHEYEGTGAFFTSLQLRAENSRRRTCAIVHGILRRGAEGRHHAPRSCSRPRARCCARSVSPIASSLYSGVAGIAAEARRQAGHASGRFRERSQPGTISAGLSFSPAVSRRRSPLP